MAMKIKWKKPDGAVSEVIGAILMVGIGVALFSILYFIVMSYPFTPSVPSVDIVGSIQGDSIVLEHRGGDSLDQNATVSFSVGATRISNTVGFFLNDSNGNNRWDVGEQLVYHPPEGMTNLQVEATVIDMDSNSIMMMGVLQEGETTVIPSLTTSIDLISPYHQTSSPLTVYATGDSGLDNVTLYYRWSDDNTSWDGGYTIVDDAVDSNLCNVDGSSDIGTETNFANAQDTAPDTNVMTVQEVDVRGQNYNDAIDSNTCDVDGSPDKGTETNFVNAKGINPDTNVMTIQEVDQDAGTSTIGKTSGTGTSYTTINANQMYGQVFTATSSGEISQATFYGRSSAGTPNAKFVICDSSGVILTNGVSNPVVVSTTAGNKVATWAAGSRPIVQNGQTYWIMVVADANSVRLYYSGTTGGTNKADTTNSYGSPTNPTDATSGTINYRVLYADMNNLDYEIDSEYQFTGANFTQDNEQVCFYVTSHTGSETLYVNYRNGVSWTNLGSITTTGWTNLTANGLTSATYTIQLIGNTETSDSFQDSWNIDLIKLHCWNNSNYQIDFEYNWTSANFILSMENLGLYVVSHTGSENLNVYYWTGAAWSLLGTITTTGWWNFTATGLTSSTYTIQLKGVIESGDFVQDSWNIDLIMLHTWNITGGLHGQNWTIWPNVLNPDLTSPWNWNYTFPRGVGYYEFYSIGRYAGTVEGAPASADGRCRKT
jgi:hypothetical protein